MDKIHPFRKSNEVLEFDFWVAELKNSIIFLIRSYSGPKSDSLPCDRVKFFDKLEQSMKGICVTYFINQIKIFDQSRRWTPKSKFDTFKGAKSIRFIKLKNVSEWRFGVVRFKILIQMFSLVPK